MNSDTVQHNSEANFYRKVAKAIRLLVLLLFVLVLNTACSDLDSSGTKDPADNPSNEAPSQDIKDDDPDDGSESPDGEEEPVFQVFTETGGTGMRVTYSPATLTALTNVEELESVYADLMACVGLASAAPPSLLFTDDESQFFVREDGTDVRGYFDSQSGDVIVFAEDLDENFGNKYWWTRHGLIQYLIDEHGLNPDSSVSPFLQCHWAG